MKCILHIGTEKTGTTLLQEWLYANQKALSAQKIYLSDMLEKPNNRLFPVFFQEEFDDWAMGKGISTQKEKQQLFDGFLGRFSAEINQAAKNHDVFVITSEHLHSRIRKRKDIREIKGFTDQNFDDIKVVCYFRDQFDMGVSIYSTMLKGPSSVVAVESFLKETNPTNYYYNFLEIADNWSAVFGKNNCIYKIYDRNRFIDRDIRKDFLQEVSSKINMRKLDFSLSSANESLTRLEAAAYPLINRHVPFWSSDGGGLNNLNQQIKSRVSKIKSLKRGKITSNSRDKITKLFEDSNREFFRKYFDESSSFGDKSDDPKQNEQFTLEEVENIVRDIFEAILPFTTSAINLEDKDADVLRDIAVKIENGDPLSLNYALALMELAKRARPDGPFINNKVQEYKKKLSF